MKDKYLDDIIREKLERLYIPFQPDTWERFERRLDEEESGMPEPSETDLDEAFFNKLHQLSPPYQPENWSRMADRLDREFVRPEQVLRYKVMELTLVLLIALTFWQLLPTTPLSESTVLNTHSSFPAPLSSPEVRPDRTTAEPGSNFLPATDSETSPSLHSAGADQPPADPEISEAAGLPYSPASRLLSPLGRAENTLKSIKTDRPSPDFTAATPPTDPGLITGLPAPAASPLPEAGPFGKLSQPVEPPAPQRYLFFGMFGGPEYNRIITPSDYFLDVATNEFDRYEPGYSGGVSVGLGLGDWELQSGFIYTAKQYPSINLLLRHGNSRDGYTVEQFKDVQLNILQLPLNTRYNFLHKDRWRLYVTAGASLNVATHANYFIDKEGSRRSVLSERIENGWLEGGTFRENSFLTGNIGFGFERFVTGRWSFFAQPTYQHTIYSFNRGFGPTNDRMNTLSIYTGIRIRMKR